jgi:hypothetical protein
LLVSRAGAVFSPEGALQDETMRRQLAEFIAGFAAFSGAGPS